MAIAKKTTPRKRVVRAPEKDNTRTYIDKAIELVKWIDTP